MSKILLLTSTLEAGCYLASCLNDVEFNMPFEELRSAAKKKSCLIGDIYIISWSYGHLFREIKPKEIREDWSIFTKLPSPEDYRMEELAHQIKFVPADDKNKQLQIRVLEELLGRKDISSIVIATDADANGELIGRNMIFLINPNINVPIYRLWNIGPFSSKTAVKEALADLQSYDNEKYNALFYSEIARRRCDYLLGMKLSKVLSSLYGKAYFIGRVKIFIVALLGNRQLKINAFQANGPQLLYSLSGKIGDLELSHFFYEDGEDSEKSNDKETCLKVNNYYNKNVFDDVLRTLKASELTGSICSNSKKIISSPSRPLPLNSTDFASEMLKKYKITLAQCTEILRYLWQKDFISYPNTTGRYFLTSEYEKVEAMFSAAKQFLELYGFHTNAVFSIDNVVFNDAKAAKQSHAPLTPKLTLPSADDIEKWKTSELPHIEDAYILILQHFLSVFCDDDIIEEQHLSVDIAGLSFELVGQQLLCPGWRALLCPEFQDTTFLADLKVGTKVKFDDLVVNQHETECPEQYTLHSLVETLLNITGAVDKAITTATSPEEKKKLIQLRLNLKQHTSIGTEETRSSTIQELIANNIIELDSDTGQITLSSSGQELYKLIPAPLKSIALTANWETGLEAIRHGELDYEEFIASIDATIMDKLIPSVFANLGKHVPIKKKQPAQIIDVFCPICGQQLLESEVSFRCTLPCKVSIFKDQTRTIGRELTLNDLEKFLESDKDRPFDDKANGTRIFFDPEEKYFVGVLWAAKPKKVVNTKPVPAPGVVYEAYKTFRLDDKYVFKKFRGYLITISQAEELLNGGSVVMTRVSAETKKDYKILCTLGENGLIKAKFLPIKSLKLEDAVEEVRGRLSK